MRNTPDAERFIELAERDGVAAVIAERDGPSATTARRRPEEQPDPHTSSKSLSRKVASTAMASSTARPT